MIIENFTIEISKSRVFMLVDCADNIPVYEQVEEEYNNLIKDMNKYIEPKAGIIKGKIPSEVSSDSIKEGTDVLYALLTVGRKGPELVSALFREGNYLSGMIADAMLDDYLFQMDSALKPYLMELAHAEKKGIAERLEAPGGIAMQVQKVIHDALEAEITMHIGIKESFMYDPVKSIGHVYVLSDETKEFKTEHDCSKCDRKECKFKQYENNSTAK